MQEEHRHVVAVHSPNDSVTGSRIASELRERRFNITLSVGSDTSLPRVSGVVEVVDSEAGVSALRDSLDRRHAPTLVLVKTAQLAASVMPVLESRQDLALTSDPADLIAWRMQRLIDASCREERPQSQLDALTNLLNRRAIESVVQQMVDSPPLGATVGLLMLDLDRFKTINDSFGHVAGDRALRAVGDVLCRSVRPGDQLARVGGDEFVCVMVRDDWDAIIHDGQRLLDEIADLDTAGALARPAVERLTASAGVTLVRPDAKVATLFSEADMAAYAAKNDGRNRLVASPDLSKAAAASSRDLNLVYFENSTRLATERFAEMIALRSRKMLREATRGANTCSVTGLYSRAYLDLRLPSEMAEARLRGRSLTVALIDVDHFKSINTTYGWPSGDRVLRAFGEVVKGNLRSSDWAAKYGGDEFLLVFPDSTPETAERVVERVREDFASVTVESVDGAPVRATLSAGVAQMPEREVSAEALLNEVAKSLNRAKEDGRNRVLSRAKSSRDHDEADGLGYPS